jgi:hypothetical protein
VAFPLGRRGADAIGGALDQAVRNEEEQRERPVDFGYKNGAPVRFAGERIARNMGMNGDFGRMTGDKKDKDAQGYLKEWVSQWTNGFASPMGNGGPSSEEVA